MGEPIFSEMATHVEIEDEASGEFIVVTQEGGSEDKEGIHIAPAEWPAIRAAIDQMMGEIAKHERDQKGGEHG